MSGTFRFVAAAAGSAVSLGLVIITATVLGIRVLRFSEPAGPALYLLFGGTMAGVLAAAGTAWWLLGPIQSSYRRGGLAMVSGFATVLLMLFCIPVDQLFGSTGLLAAVAACILAAVLLGRRARRLGMNP